LPPDEKILLQAIENMQEASLSQTLEAIGELKKQQKQNDPSVMQKWLDEHSKDIHKKLDGHRKNHDDLARQMMDGMPDHDTIMKGVHGLLAQHMGDHSGKLMSSINRLPLPPDEKVLLQAIENMQEASLSQTLDAITKLRKQQDPSCVQQWLEDHSKSLHKKLDGHSKNHDALAKAIKDGLPEHEQIMKGVHGLLAQHVGDHSGKIMSSINKLPLPPDEKVMLQAIENMQEAVLGQTLEAIAGIQKKMDLKNVTQAIDNIQMQVSVTGVGKSGTSEAGVTPRTVSPRFASPAGRSPTPVQSGRSPTPRRSNDDGVSSGSGRLRMKASR
jgi:hypothetical protein